jgi:hypothetical protein
MEIKSTLHIPVEQYGFVEIELTKGIYDEKVKDEIFEKYQEIKDKFSPGVSTDKLLEMINSFSMGQPAMLEDYEKLNEPQTKIIQAVKRAYNRSPLAKVETNEEKFKKDLK